MKNLITFSLIAIPQICLGCILGTISKRLSITQRNYVLIILSIPITYLHKLVLHIHWPLRTTKSCIQLSSYITAEMTFPGLQAVNAHEEVGMHKQVPWQRGLPSALGRAWPHLWCPSSSYSPLGLPFNIRGPNFQDDCWNSQSSIIKNVSHDTNILSSFSPSLHLSLPTFLFILIPLFFPRYI